MKPTIKTAFESAVLNLKKDKRAKKISIINTFKSKENYFFYASLTFMHQYVTIRFNNTYPFKIEFNCFNENYLKSIGKKGLSSEKRNAIKEEILNIFSEVIILDKKDNE